MQARVGRGEVHRSIRAPSHLTNIIIGPAANTGLTVQTKFPSVHVSLSRECLSACFPRRRVCS